MEDIRIIDCTSGEMPAFVEFVSRGGWNVGMSDYDYLFRVDPDAYLMALIGNEVVGTVAAVKYGTDFGFIGYHNVRPDMQRRGIGKALLEESVRRLRGRTIGLNCYEAQVEFYREFGFSPAHSIIAFEGQAESSIPDSQDLVSPFLIAFERLHDFDRTIYPYDRKKFISCWHAQPQSMLMGRFVGNEYMGYGMFRPARYGYKISPLLCDGPETASKLLEFLVANLPQGSRYYLDVPSENLQATTLAEERGMRRCGELIRMYAPSAPALALNRIYSLPAVEIG